MNDDEQVESGVSWIKADWLKVALIGSAGYLLGSVFPAGYVNYLIRSILLPETVAYQEPVFDRSLLDGAEEVAINDLTSTLDANPSLFDSIYLEKPVIIEGEIKFFLNGGIGNDGQTLSLETGQRYGTGIILTFDDRTSEDVLALREGEVMRAVCFVTGTTTDSIHMNHCESVE